MAFHLRHPFSTVSTLIKTGCRVWRETSLDCVPPTCCPDALSCSLAGTQWVSCVGTGTAGQVLRCCRGHTCTGLGCPQETNACCCRPQTGNPAVTGTPTSLGSVPPTTTASRGAPRNVRSILQQEHVPLHSGTELNHSLGDSDDRTTQNALKSRKTHFQCELQLHTDFQ